MKTPSSIFRSLTLRIPVRSSVASSAVVPLPIRSSFDQQLTVELDALHSSSSTSAASSVDQSSHYYTWILQALKASRTSQQITLASLANLDAFQDSDRNIIDRYLDSNTRMLDTCNELKEKIEIIHNYAESLKVVSHLLEGNAANTHPATVARIVEALDSCRVLERRGNEMGRGELKKMLSSQKQDSRLGEMLSGSMAVTSTVCAILESALSFKSKRGFPSTQALSLKTAWSFSLQQIRKQVKEQDRSSSAIAIIELQHMVKAAKSLRDQIKHRKQNDQLRVDVEELKRNCGIIEEGIKPLEESVNELYKNLVSVRMALLGILSKI